MSVTTGGAGGGRTIDELLSIDAFALSAAPRPTVGATDRWMRRAGPLAGALAFVAIAVAPTPSGLTRPGQLAAAAFALALIWWVTEPIPTYVTSLVLMLLLVLTKARAPADVMSVLGLDVIWLNVLAFILSAMLVKTHLARRMSLALLERFGKRATTALGAFVILQLVLAPLIPATAARAALTLPIMLAVAAMYGSTAGSSNNFGRNLLLLNLVSISVLSSTVMTGSAANIMAVGFIEALGGSKVYYTDWLLASAPVAILTVAAAWWLGPKTVFPLRENEREAVVANGLDAVRSERLRLGKLRPVEWRALVIFALVIVLWATDRFHQRWFGVEISAPFAAMVGAILALLPRVGVLEWNDTNVPWHLMIFSAGAYAGGLALDDTGAAAWAVKGVFGGVRLEHVAFGWAYAVVMAVMLYSHLLSTSKTVRTVIMVPLVIATARSLGWDPVSLALPAAFTIDWVIGLPISGKPNVILFGANQYSTRDNLVYGLIVCTVGYALFLIAGATWFHWLGLTPAFTAVR